MTLIRRTDPRWADIVTVFGAEVAAAFDVAEIDGDRISLRDSTAPPLTVAFEDGDEEWGP